MSEAPEPVVLIIADISGYTRYMTANAKTLAHSQTIITELVNTIVKQVDLPLEVAKLEGDAVFLFGRKDADARMWKEKKKVIGEKLILFFDSFRRKVGELSRSTTCHCSACTHIEKLRLKLIVHSGEVLFHKVLNFTELAGVDVIIVHRLLKNSVNSDQYLLVTEAAQRDVELPTEVRLTNDAETYDEIGRVSIGVYYPEGVPEAVRDGTPKQDSVGARFLRAWSLSLKLWFRPVNWIVNGDGGKFGHLISSGSQAGRWAFALLTIVLTPIYVPVGACFALLSALRKPSG